MKVLDSWEKARRCFHYPALKEPKVLPDFEGGACFNFKTRETLVSERFIKSTSERGGISEETCLEATFLHEIGHYMRFPKTLGTFLLAAKMVDDFFNSETNKKGEETRGFILQTYADMANDMDSALDGNRSGPILSLRESLQSCSPDKVNHSVRAVMLVYLEKQAGRPFELDEELKPYLERMLEINFLETEVNKLRVNLYMFGNIVCDMIGKFAEDGGGGGKGPGKPSKKMGQGSDKGECAPEGDSGDIHDADIKELLETATSEEIREALREIAGKVSKREYDKTVEWLKEKAGSEKKIPEAPKKAITVGTSMGDLVINADGLQYYKELSKNYPLVVVKKLLETDAKIRTWTDTEKWRPGIDPNLVRTESSGGKFLPGITKAIRISENPIKSRDYKLPHVLVVIDSSGSMPNPLNYKSYAVLGAYCVARSYYTHGASVGVINFSGISFYLPYTRELDSALGAISAYQGGGTTADIDMIRTMLGDKEAEQYKSDPTRDLSRLPRSAIKKQLEVAVPDEIFAAEYLDVVMFTDGGIYNLGEVLALLDDRAELNRATIVLSHGFSQDLPELQGHKTNILQIESEEEIPNIILKETQKGFNSLEWRK